MASFEGAKRHNPRWLFPAWDCLSPLLIMAVLEDSEWTKKAEELLERTGAEDVCSPEKPMLTTTKTTSLKYG
jgi:hypothetical protein